MVVEPVEPGEPETLTLDVYSEPPPCVPSGVVENLKGCQELLESDWSNRKVCPSFKVKVGLTTPST